jgi:Zn-dependent peptidase ImmA (M78 family)/transcriptional regulator with XRE-family HTH domain
MDDNLAEMTGWRALGLDGPPELTGQDQAERDEIGARIAQTRRKLGMTGTKLAELVELRKDQISKIESGRRGVDVGELPRFADALCVSVRYLLGMPERPAMAISARLASDALPTATAPARRLARQLLGYDDLLDQIGESRPARPSVHGARVVEQAAAEFIDAPTTKTRARAQGLALAELVRAELDLGSDMLGDLATVIEMHFAVDVSLAPLGVEADGLCVHAGSTSLIVASSDYSDGHLRFTLAHELAHHLFGDPRGFIEEDEHAMFADGAIEWRANAFAGHLLMPERGVRSVLDWIRERPAALTDRAVAALMEHFGVSRQALLYQLNLLGLMSYADGKRICREHTVTELIDAHRDVAPTGAAMAVSRVYRAPRRLVHQATVAAREERTGLTIIAGLLRREDDETLWNEIMGPEPGPTTPVPL